MTYEALIAQDDTRRTYAIGSDLYSLAFAEFSLGSEFVFAKTHFYVFAKTQHLQSS